MPTRPGLTESDHENMDLFLYHVLEAYWGGEITKVQLSQLWPM